MADDIVKRLRSEMHYRPDSAVIAAAANLIEAQQAEIERLRNAIDSVLINIDSDHQPEWASAESKAAGKKPWCCQWCGPQEGGWPCVHRMALDELKEARRGI